MSVLADLGRTLWKMFAADLPMTIAALAVVGCVGLGVAQRVLPTSAAPIVLTAGVLAALVIAIARATRR